jgi:hypothetical protein
MKLTGHKTESVYRRYAIVSDKDLRDAGLKLSRTLQEIASATATSVSERSKFSTAGQRRSRDRIPLPNSAPRNLHRPA